MISSVVVTYRVKPECVEEHVRLIEAVLAQLRAEQPADVEYKVLRLDNGVTFVHVSTTDTADGASPLPGLSAFQEFGRELPSRVATQPNPTAADIIGSYLPATPLVTSPTG